MGNKNFQKIISLLIVISLAFVIPYFRFTQVAKAQSVTSYITGISGAITKLPLCTSKTTNAVKGAFSGGTSGISGGISSLIDQGGNYISDVPLEEIVDIGLSEQNKVEVYDSKVNEKLDEQKKDIEEIKKSNSAMSENDTCLKSIGRLIIKMLLQKLTMSTVEWINGGYDGTPKFIQDPEQYFKDIGKEEILKFGQEVNDPKLYPFAKDFMQAQVNSYKNKFANNAQYSLDKMIYNSSNGMYNAQNFGQDFSQGGWDAWNAMIQNSANNPLGFALMASNELAKRIEDKTELAKGSLQYGSGFLGVQKCANPEGVTKEEDQAGLIERSSSPTGPYQNRICETWQTVTPGSMIASAATRTMQNEETSLLKADDLNDAIAALIDAFANSMTSKIQNDGFFDLAKSDEFQYGMEGQFVYNEDSGISYNSPQVEQDFSESQIAHSSFLSANPNFNIRTDLTQALIDEQRIFIDKLIEQNKEIIDFDPKRKYGEDTGYRGIIPTIYQLDYCIPGPHPGWENDSFMALNEALDQIIPHTSASLEDMEAREVEGMVVESAKLAATAAGMAIGATILSVIPGIGTVVGAVAGAIVGWITGVVIDAFNGTDGEQNARIYWNNQWGNFTNSPLKHCLQGTSCEGGTKEEAQRHPVLHYKEAFVEAIYTAFSRYKDIVYNFYRPERMPMVTEEAKHKFLQLKGYTQIKEKNDERITSMKSIVVRLDTIKKEIDKLNCQIDETCSNYPGTNEKATHITQDEYNKGISEWTSAFSRISATMVSGDDIAKAINLTKQLIDEREYIYKDLLKGPNGCEDSMEYLKGQDGVPGTGMPGEFFDSKRRYIGMPILYDYNWYTKPGSDLPDPYNTGIKTKMTRELWPGLVINKEQPKIVYALFSNNGTGNWCDPSKGGKDYWDGENPHRWGRGSDGKPNQNMYLLCISDKVPVRDSGGWVHDVFESMIGIY